MNLIKRNLTFVIDGIFFILVLSAFLVDILYFKSIYADQEYENFFKYSDIVVTSLLSITLTVVSILIAFPKNELYGISLKDIQKIISWRFYSLLHMFIISCIIFSLI